MIDLRSDTVTRPTPAMREAIAGAEVGDDVLGDDPTVQRLEATVAALLGKEAALFMPSGIMANETALLCLAPPATEVVVEATCHLVDWEDAAPAFLAGVQLRGIATPDGLLTAELVEAAIQDGGRFHPPTSLVCIENTHNAAGGRILPIAEMRAIRRVALERGVPVHLDGARLWNASAATGIAESEFAALADTVMVTLSKGLGCPVGSVLAGPRDVMDRAWRVRRRLGGGMRQAGILAAAGLHALEHHRDRLPDDHARARRLAQLASEVPGLHVVAPETNIVMFDILHPDLDSTTVLDRLAARGVRMSEFTRRRIRAVTHMDVDDDDIRTAAAALAEAVPEGADPAESGTP